jgi:hypothetical protein
MTFILRPLAIRRQFQPRRLWRWRPILRLVWEMILVQVPVSRRSLRYGVNTLGTFTRTCGLPAPIQHYLSLRPHVLVELVCFIHLVCFCLFGVQPPLKQLGVVSAERLITFFDLTEFKLEGIDLIMENLHRVDR